MAKYLFFRILRGIGSVILVTAVVMALVYSALDRNLIFASDPVFSRQKGNAKQVYQMQQWENYGYVDYVPYADYLGKLLAEGEISQETYDSAVVFGDAAAEDSAVAGEFVAKFQSFYEEKGYAVVRLNATYRSGTQKYQEGGQPRLFAWRDLSLPVRLWNYLRGIVTIDTVNAVSGDVGQRELRFTWYDPAYGGEVFAPAVMGNGTAHKYLLYFDGKFPFLHQNFLTIHLGKSFSIDKGVDVWQTMTRSQGSRETALVTYPTGLQVESGDDLHTAVYVEGSYENGDALLRERFVDDYTGVTTCKAGLSKLGYSFVIGILSVGLSYGLAVPLGVWMARHRNGLVDRLGTIFIVFIMAVPSLGYIFLFKAIGGAAGLPTVFDMEEPEALMFVLPVLSLALPSAANLMKWLRRYMLDQSGAEYVKFARAAGLSEGEVFTGHVLKNAAIPIVHGIPAAVLGAMVGAIITERVYVVPGAGNLLTNAINAYDNGVIVGLALFYGVLSVASVILGDVLMGTMDPRVSFGRRR